MPRCTAEPERWTTADPDTQAVAVCGLPAPSVVRPRGLPRHGVYGLWAGIAIPEFALRRLRAVAERGGYQVTPRRRGRPPAPGI